MTTVIGHFKAQCYFLNMIKSREKILWLICMTLFLLLANAAVTITKMVGTGLPLVLPIIILLFLSLRGTYLWRLKKIEGRPVLLVSALALAQAFFSGLVVGPTYDPYLQSLHFFSSVSVMVVVFYYLSKIRGELSVQLTNSKVFLLRLTGVLLAFQMLYGSMTKGLRAGFLYGTFPLMNGSFLPPAGLSLLPQWINIFENPVTVQWVHRWLGVATLLSVYLLGYVFIKSNPKNKGPFIHLMGISTSQVVVGILSLVLQVPTVLAVAHQFIAALIVLGYFNIIFRIKEA